ncbi:alpha/beta fold hydrolase [Lacicoccus alkaliphilus]|uniref:Pimeloyl-ACP methyl ester carboxylesterase n=1 Tax=Lacicoccus alkaliphilus DSM 16010 TaxID=1123231 RepID=A0A1M7DXI5_9BACL|nr:alpha/beta hydrolase [Salinicoccus alkaliphilus]SHL84214.1 Pimeloyl-ACP methyl ester carboxylesterase [Salinicoccus alkaliphilus DSM 16010]
MKVINTKDKQMNANITQHAESDVLMIFIHGLTGNYLQMHHFQNHFKDKYNTMSYDLSGRGDSTMQKDPSGIAQHSEDLLEMIESLGYDKIILAGYSMGGYIAIDVAGRTSKVKKIVLLDGGGEADGNTSKLVIPSLGRLEKTFESRDEYLEMMKQSYGAMGIEWSGVMDRVIDHEITQVEDKVMHKSDYHLTKQDFGSFYEFPYEAAYKKVRVPVFLVICTGPIKDDTALFSKEGYDKMLETIEEIDSTVKGINHYEIVFNAQEDLNEKIEKFLDEE